MGSSTRICRFRTASISDVVSPSVSLLKVASVGARTVMVVLSSTSVRRPEASSASRNLLAPRNLRVSETVRGRVKTL